MFSNSESNLFSVMVNCECIFSRNCWEKQTGDESPKGSKVKDLFFLAMADAMAMLLEQAQ